MPDPLTTHGELDEALTLAVDAARAYLAGLDERPLHDGDPDRAAARLRTPLPEDGDGAPAALRALVEDGLDGSVASAGPRCFHFVTGGVTPAALAADWLASTLDQNTAAWVESPLGAELERLALDWLTDLFRLPGDWGGVLTTGATMANFVGLAAARTWWGDRHGVDVAEQGLAGLPPVPVLTSGHLHSSAAKALGMLGIGRANVHRLACDAVGTLDSDALVRALAALDGAPAILVANAGEVNAGHFDPIAEMADLAERHGSWLHVDGAFGLFARTAPAAAAHAEGIERAQSVISDGHKWLNVPYDCGFAFVRDRSLLPRVFGATAAYLPPVDFERPNFAYLGPEGSRRARSLAVWATLRAYGRNGVRAMVERHLALAQRIADRVDQAPDLERLADVPLNIVCFRYRPPNIGEDALDDLNASLGEAVLADGRVFVGTTLYGGRVAFRPAIVNWRTREQDVDLLVDVIRELGARLNPA
ncbi:MAG: aspartate aminotransferase family protein [Actinobacteria bacterium]|nr:aspartate aminotransferase family protein [Actinomycetota bacterium]